jgi:pilus assembly protein CpaF
MIRLKISEPDSNRLHEMHELSDGAYTIGRTEDNNIVINNPAVSSKHALIRIKGNDVSITDLKSTNGTYVAGESITPNQEVHVVLLHPVIVGIFELIFTNDKHEVLIEEQSYTQYHPGTKKDEEIDKFKAIVQKKLFEQLDLVRLEAQNIDKEELKTKASKKVVEIVGEMASQLPAGKTQQQIVKEILDEALGLGPLEDLLADKSITEIMVVKRDQIYIEKSGKILLSDARFSSNEHLRHAIERIVSSKGRRIDELHPYVDTRLDNGSRVNAVIPPVAIDSPILTIRKFPERRFNIQDLINFGSCTEEMAKFLEICIKHRKSSLISGGTGSGKTTLLNVLAAFIPNNERIITIEDSAELNLPQEHVVRLEARPANIEGRGEIAIRDLVKNCLRMRPDRIVVGECRGGEAIDMLQAMNTGHDGSMTTLHANTPYDTISRLTTMCLMSDLELPSRSIQEQIASAISLIVQTARMVDGQRRIIKICEVVGVSENGVKLDTIFEFKETGHDADGKIIGKYVCVKSNPLILQQLSEQNIEVPKLRKSEDTEDKTDRLPVQE